MLPHRPLTVKMRDGMGVRSWGWIMDRMEGRWPSLAPTKNSLWTEQWAFSLLPTCPQAGQGVERAHPKGRAPCVGFPASLRGSAGKGKTAFLISSPPGQGFETNS